MFNLQAFKDANVHSYVQIYKLAHCLACIVMCMNHLQGWLCCVLCNSILSTVGQYLCFKSRMSGSKYKSSGDIAGTVLYFSRYFTVKLKTFSLSFVFILYV